MAADARTEKIVAPIDLAPDVDDRVGMRAPAETSEAMRRRGNYTLIRGRYKDVGTSFEKPKARGGAVLGVLTA